MPRQGNSRHVLLVVDDHHDSREMLALELRKQGYEVVEAADGRAALEAAERARPDLVLMDLSMPVLDGLSAVYRMREGGASRRVPVIALTAHADATHSNAARALGCDEYITKPVDLPELNRVISRLLLSGGTGHDESRPARNDDELTTYIDGLIGEGR